MTDSASAGPPSRTNAARAAELLSQLILVARRAVETSQLIPADEFEYKASVAAFNEIVLQHAEAFRLLATTEETFYFAGASCARSAFEAAIAAAWICEPKETIEKEGRWLGYQQQMETFHRNQAAEFADIDPTLDESAQPLRALLEFLKTRKIGGANIPVDRKPSVEAMLKDIGYGRLYSSYREVCEIVHIKPEMLVRFKKGEEGGIRIVHRMFETDWFVPFFMIGWSVAISAMVTVTELGRDRASLRYVHIAQVDLQNAATALFSPAKPN